MLLQAGLNPRVAVILNPNARGVRPEILSRLGSLVSERHLYVSRDVAHSREIARTVMERAYEGVLVGGGDGTFVQCLSDLAGEAEALRAPLPRVGVLRLGTGNALAEALSAASPTAAGLAHDLRRARHAEGNRTLSMLAVEGRLTPFAGCGLDAQILDDYRTVGRRLDRVHVGRYLGASARYALAVASRSVPRFVLSALPEVEVVNRGAPALRIDWRSGRPIDEAPIGTGEVLFRGRVALCSGSTIPYFGLKMKMFPFAHLRADRFQLRCVTAGASETLLNLPAVFRGEYRSANLHDFLVDHVEVRLDRAVPFQVGGDLCEGTRDRFELQRSEQPVRVFA